MTISAAIRTALIDGAGKVKGIKYCFMGEIWSTAFPSQSLTEARKNGFLASVHADKELPVWSEYIFERIAS